NFRRENASEKGFAHSITGSNAVSDFCRSGSAKRFWGDAERTGYRLQRFEFPSFAASSQAQQEFASQGPASPDHQATQHAAVVAASLCSADLRESLSRSMLQCKTGSQSAPRFDVFCFVGRGILLTARQ